MPNPHFPTNPLKGLALIYHLKHQAFQLSDSQNYSAVLVKMIVGVTKTVSCLQVVLSKDQTVSEGQVIAESLMSDLGVEKEDLISGAYVDFLLK